jgi:curli production assembly/transport component CsgF
MVVSTAAALILCATSAAASDLSYEPRNPSFGGNPLNGQYLLNKARAQDDTEPPDQGGDLGLSQDPADRFKRQLQSRLLGDLADQVSTAIFGEESGQDPQDSGEFQYGDVKVSFDRGVETVNIDIQNVSTGETTQISVPIFDSGGN